MVATSDRKGSKCQYEYQDTRLNSERLCLKASASVASGTKRSIILVTGDDLLHLADRPYQKRYGFQVFGVLL